MPTALVTATEGLAAIIDQRAREIFASDGDRDSMADAKDLVRALARMLAGQSLKAAFGSPGDWGYHTPIGKALYAVYAEQSISGTAADEIRILERSLAYDEASSRVDCNCGPERESAIEDDWWSNIDDVSEGATAYVADAVRYLDSRGLLERHPNHPNWVRVLDEDAAPVEEEATR